MTTLLMTEQLTLQVANTFICQALNLTVKAGEIWGIIGLNGSGKTTLLHTLAGLIRPFQGKIYLGEKNLNALTAKEIARSIGILFQDTSYFFPQAVFDFCMNGRYPHVNYFRQASDDDKKIALTALALVELEKKLLQNIQTLSGGERRRLAIATLLTQTPQLYLLDEPTNHLDLHHQIKLLDHFKQLAEKNPVSILMALHDVHIAHHYCTHILMLFADRECLFGETPSMLNTTNLSRLYQRDFQKLSHKLFSYSFNGMKRDMMQD
ncbi:MAG: hypothetical protein ACD_45C00118G0012 [uncultured bacterium]|nr:MAG: hypothetical protein ACD_45C00118G0012 [uncultured bacterium]